MSGLILIHTVISLVAIASGVVAMAHLFQSRSSSLAITIFLVLAALTSFTGFFLPYHTITPALVVSVLALAILAVVVYAQGKVDESWLLRLAFVGGMVVSLYLLVFVGVVQAFLKIAPLHAAAPTQKEPPFLVAQIVALLGFVALGVFAARSFHPQRAASPLVGSNRSLI